MKYALTAAVAALAMTVAAPALAQQAGHGGMDHSQHAMPGMEGMEHGAGGLKSSAPADGSTVAAPKTLSLTFPHAMKLDMVTLTGPSGQPFKLPVAKAAAAETVTVKLPALQAGAWKAAWHATGADGHMMAGAVRFTVR